MSVVERFANPEGRSTIRYYEDGAKIVTGGPDGDIHLFGSANENDDEVEHDPFYTGDEILGLAVSQKFIYVAPKIDPVGTTDVISMYFEGKKGVGHGVATKFTAEATCVDASKDNEFVLAGSADMTLKLVNTKTFKEKVFEGHLAPLLSCALDPKGEFALSSSCDGTVKVWKIESDHCLKTWKGCWDKANDVCRSTTPGQISWHPKGSKLAIPMKSFVKLVERNKWEEEKLLKSNSPEDEFTAVAFSNDVIVAGTSKGRLVFWNVNDNSIINECETQSESAIQSLDYHPSKEEVIYIKHDGQFGAITNFMNGTKASNAKTVLQASETSEKKESAVDEDNMDADELAAALFDDDDENENSFSIRQIKKDTGFLDNEDTNTNLTAPGGDDDDKDSVISKALTETEKPEEQASSAIPMPNYYEPDIQEAFQPGSTPAHLESRFMVWNSVGIVKSFNSDVENSIDVEFHDVAIHHPIHLGNSYGYTMADLSPEAIVLATEGEDDVPAKLTCHYFATSALVKEWSIDMPEKEGIMAVCCGIGWVAAATDRRNLRIFTVGGMQREVLALPGPTVAMSGFKDKLMISAHLGLALPGNQCIGTAVFHVGKLDHQLPHFNSLPLAPSSYLAWQGFTDEGVPCTMDSVGFIRILNSNYGSSWTQVCDSKSIAKGKSDHYFMVGANLQEFSARCILVKGTRYPSTLPKPVMTVLPLKLNLCGNENEKFANEQTYWKNIIIARAIDQMNDTPIVSKEALETEENQALLKLLAHACQLEQEVRALDICKLMSSTTLQIAIKYASKNGRMQLANKISQMACQKQEEEERTQAEREVYFSQDSEDIIYGSQNVDEAEIKTPENPFLAAQARKEKMNSSSNFTQLVNNSGGNFNPFKKTNTPNSVTSSGGRSGTVFDEMSRKDVLKSGGLKSKSSFGDKSKLTPPSSRMVSFPKKSIVPKDKENKTDNLKETPATDDEDNKPLKGFLLWFEENSQKVSHDENVTDSDDLRNRCLSIWQTMSKTAKEDYKSPRIPKRKREDGDTGSTASKLARFAAK